MKEAESLLVKKEEDTSAVDEYLAENEGSTEVDNSAADIGQRQLDDDEFEAELNGGGMVQPTFKITDGNSGAVSKQSSKVEEVKTEDTPDTIE